MSGAVPSLPHTLSCAQEQRCLYIYRSVINISGLFHISELLLMEVFKIMRTAVCCTVKKETNGRRTQQGFIESQYSYMLRPGKVIIRLALERFIRTLYS
jgi:hypothetical protein